VPVSPGLVDDFRCRHDGRSRVRVSLCVIRHSRVCSLVGDCSVAIDFDIYEVLGRVEFCINGEVCSNQGRDLERLTG